MFQIILDVVLLIGCIWMLIIMIRPSKEARIERRRQRKEEKALKTLYGLKIKAVKNMKDS